MSKYFSLLMLLFISSLGFALVGGWTSNSGTSFGNSYVTLSQNGSAFADDFESFVNTSYVSNPLLNVSGRWNYTNTTNNAGINTMVLSVINNSGYSQLDFNQSFSGPVSAVVSARSLPDTNGLVLDLHMDEGSGLKAYDKSGYGNNGTLTNMNGGLDNGTSGRTSSGRYGKALKFEGNTFVNISNFEASLTSQLPITIAFWANDKTPLVSGVFLDTTFDRNGAPQRGGFMVFRYSTGGYPILLFENSTNSPQYDFTNAVYPANTWVFFTFVANTTTILSYVNGKLNQTISITTPNIQLNNVSNTLFIGRSGDNWGRFNGTIDEVKIYNRSLSALEISAEYNRSVGFYYGGVKYPLNATYDWQTYNVEGMTGTGNLSLYADGAYSHYFDNLRVSQNLPNTTNSTQNSGLINPTDNITVTFLPNSSHVVGAVNFSWIKNGVINYTQNYANKTLNSTLTPMLASGSSRFTVNDVWSVNLTYNLATNTSQIYSTQANSLTINDTAVMNITINSPQNTTYNTSTLDLNFTVSDGDGVSQCRYSLDNTANISLATCQNTTINNILKGGHNLRLWANDTWNYWYSTITYFSMNDVTPPSINLQTPTSQIYATTSIGLNYTTWDLNNISQCKYELNGVNTTLATCQNITITAVEGANTIKVWANDTSNNWNSSNIVYFTVDTPTPLPTSNTYNPITLLGNLYLLFRDTINFNNNDLIGIRDLSLEGGIRYGGTGIVPNCTSAKRGLVQFIQNNGVEDSLSICMRNSTGSYLWRNATLN